VGIGLFPHDSSRHDSLTAAGVVAALDAEARTLGPLSKREDGLWLTAEGTLVAVSGVGHMAAADSARALIEAGATALVSWGMAGGLDPELLAGAVCLPSVVISAEGAHFATDPHWRELVRSAIHGHRTVVHGTLLTTLHAIDRVDAKRTAFRETGAVAVDMESTAIAAVAATRGVPFLAIRVIVDSAADSLPPSVVAASAAGQVRKAHLIRGLLRSPADIAPLLRLAKRYRAATQALRAVARSGALAPLSLASSKMRIA
jgi:adenosylhomocysteine nucleosidase